MKKIKRKLVLPRETIRVLTEREARGAEGGFLPTSHVACDTFTCDTCP